MARRAVVALVGVIVALAVAVLALQTGLWVDVVGVGEYDRGTVTVTDSDNSTPCCTTTPTETTTAAPCTVPPNRTAVATCEGSRALGTVDVRISDTFDQRRLGLSDTESLGPNEGMLFVHDEEGEYPYVMRDMDFDIDIIFIDANRTITTIHHASKPPEGESYSEQYSGRGKYVLEVNRGWANRTGTSVGDTVELPAGVD
ncbi:DUF192 domain-containing protein [Halomicroarcula sp. F28]|uniref:DUF192 domain-containing protein n=1 Tax=Haloarcula salinisoli TaxID=2487746 RepID=UPI001C7365FD|nr:DUF192 domain-containing protein [Halomicroarcula salinisoli]MBX0288140.1 DUF192 domain-containing protein [Halomicroarcula salinisoli]